MSGPRAIATASGGLYSRGMASSRSARWLLIAYLAFSLVAKVADANPHENLWYVPWVVACYILPIWYLNGRAREPWLRVPWLLLGLQAACGFVPLALFGSEWVGGIDGLLGALVLLVVRSPARWWLLGVLAAVEVAARSLVGFPYEPPLNAGIWVLVSYLNVALGLYGLALAVTLLERLEATTEVLADIVIDQQRFATAQGLQTSILQRLEQVRQHADAALLATGDAAIAELQQMGRTAREAAVAARRIATALPESSSAVPEGAVVSPVGAYRVVAAFVVLFALQYLDNIIMPEVGGAKATPLTSAAAVAIAAAMIVIQLHHSRPPKTARPAGWGWTFGAQVVLCFALYPAFGVASMVFLAFIGGSALLLIPHPVRWAVFAAAIFGLPLLTLVNPGELAPAIQAQWTIYAAATTAAASVLIYGLSRFARTATELADARREIADAAALRERVRIARDTHDTLGLTLSTIALKADLSEALLPSDAARARREIVQIMHLAHTVAADAESIVTGTLRLDIASELTTARDALRAAGIAVTIDSNVHVIQAPLETQLAAVLREAIANVLRHSDARTCFIRIRQDDDEFVVDVKNDGVREGSRSSGGRGLANIRSRVTAVGGTMTAGAHGDGFTLVAHLPRATTVSRAVS